jgi:hypothetical protein
MGVASSTPVSALGENPVLKRFVGADIIPADDKYWDDLLNFNLICMRNRCASLPAITRICSDTNARSSN